MITTTSANPTADIETFHGSSLELKNLTMAYGDIEVLRNVSLTVAPGTTTCIIGPSGSGKSTLLRGVNRLHEPKSGDVVLAGDSALQPAHRTHATRGQRHAAKTRVIWSVT